MATFHIHKKTFQIHKNRIWENDYEKAFKTFRTELKKEKVKLHDFKDSLYKCSPEAYQLFDDMKSVTENTFECSAKRQIHAA